MNKKNWGKKEEFDERYKSSVWKIELLFIALACQVWVRSNNEFFFNLGVIISVE